jgi:glycosyltransferase involved in cell wall biosynthesis
MLLHPPDVLFIPSHVLPIIHPRRSVVTIHDLGYLYHPRAHRPLDRLYLDLSTRYNAKASSLVIADSKATKLDLIRCYNVNPKKVIVVYPGYDDAIFRPVEDKATIEAVKARYGIRDDYILFVGTLHPRKNLGRLIEAFSLFFPTSIGSQAKSILSGMKLTSGENFSSPLSLVIAGKKGWLYEGVFHRVKELELEERVIFTGFVAEDDLPALLSGARLFVFPSLYEGFGFPVLEAMACGVPVVCSDASSLPEVVGDAALKVNPLDVEGLKDAMERVLCDEELRAEMVKRGLERARNFSWERCAEETLAVLERAGKA